MCGFGITLNFLDFVKYIYNIILKLELTCKNKSSIGYGNLFNLIIIQNFFISYPIRN